jgi:hypothetical protein
MLADLESNIFKMLLKVQVPLTSCIFSSVDIAKGFEHPVFRIHTFYLDPLWKFHKLLMIYISLRKGLNKVQLAGLP